jgi:DNA-binding transcriptional MerR regulator
MADTLQLVTRLFGSTREVAAVTGVTPVAVRAWRRRKSIPARHIAALLAAAKRRGYRL